MTGAAPAPSRRLPRGRGLPARPAIEGDPVPEALFGDYRALGEQHALTLTVRPADDPVCAEIPAVDNTCYTILRDLNAADPGARGPAAVRDGELLLGFTRVPFDARCEGTIHTYVINGDRLDFVAEDKKNCGFVNGFERRR